MTRKTRATGAVLLAVALGLGGCQARSEPTAEGGVPEPAAAPAPAAGAPKQAPSLPSTARKVIRNAQLAIEVTSPAATESKVSSVVEKLGGYVASSAHSVRADEGERQTASVNLTLRLPANRLDEALREIKRLGAGAETESIGSQDVTDEYIDVAAHIKNQKHLEEQLATILAQAKDVDGAMKVHHELTNVRTEIDRLEGRQRFLDSESAMATLTLTIGTLRPMVTVGTGEFGVSVRRAVADSVSLASNIVMFGIRAAGLLLPLVVLFGLPLLGVLLVLRRRKRRSLAAG